MKAFQWYTRALKHYTDFQGRARRREYWYFTLFNFLIAFGLSIIGVLIFGHHGRHISWLALIYDLAVFIPSLAVQVRRLHDIGRSGWWILIGFVPLLGAIVLFVFYILDSEPQVNAYGDVPALEPQVE